MSERLSDRQITDFIAKVDHKITVFQSELESYPKAEWFSYKEVLREKQEFLGVLKQSLLVALGEAKPEFTYKSSTYEKLTITINLNKEEEWEKFQRLLKEEHERNSTGK